MGKNSRVVVVGLGEVGNPLLELISRHYDAVGVDISPVEPIDQVDVLHVCYPFGIEDFVGETYAHSETESIELGAVRAWVVADQGDNLPGLRLRIHKARESRAIGARGSEENADMAFEQSVETRVSSGVTA